MDTQSAHKHHKPLMETEEPSPWAWPNDFHFSFNYIIGHRLPLTRFSSFVFLPSTHVHKMIREVIQQLNCRASPTVFLTLVVGGWHQCHLSQRLLVREVRRPEFVEWKQRSNGAWQMSQGGVWPIYHGLERSVKHTKVQRVQVTNIPRSRSMWAKAQREEMPEE